MTAFKSRTARVANKYGTGDLAELGDSTLCFCAEGRLQVLQDVKDTCHPNSNLPFAELLYCSSCSFLYMFKQNVLATFGAEFTKAIVSQVHGKQNAVLGLLVV